MSAAERLRVQPGGNIREPGSAPYQPPQLQGHLRRDNRELDKARSIPNLRMDNSFDGRPETMRPAQSVSALQQQKMPNADYYNQPHSLDESRTPDYENQPLDPRLRQQDMRGYPNASQSPGPQYSKPHHSQGPPTSKSMQNFERPQSAYYGQQDRPDFIGGRPKSDEISPEKLRNWQDMDRSHDRSHDQSFENQAPNYSNIRPQPNYANQGEIRKMDVGNQPRQPNFYENTVPRQQEPTPPFQQLRRPPSETDKNRPPVITPKPALKPNLPIVQPAEIPRSDVDNRQTQPHFYNARPQDRQVYPNTSQTSYSPSPHQSHYQNTNFHSGPSPHVNDFRNKISPSRDNFGKKGLDMPPPPGDIPPELPPPPSMEEIQDEDLPPLPPPPVTDYRLEQKIREEQNRLLQQQQQQQQQQQSDPSYSNLPPSRNAQFGSPVVQNGPRSPHDRNSFPGQHSLPPHSAGYQPPQSAGYQPQPHSLPPHSAGYSPNHDYQNINYPGKTETMPVTSGPQVHQNLYETYDPRRQQQSLQTMRPHIPEGVIKEQRDTIVSPWDREQKEKQQKQMNEDLNRLREMEIADLESRPQLTPQEQERLRKLRLDQEFQRRLQEVSGKDEEEDSDDDGRAVSNIKIRKKLSHIMTVPTK